MRPKDEDSHRAEDAHPCDLDEAEDGVAVAVRPGRTASVRGEPWHSREEETGGPQQSEGNDEMPFFMGWLSPVGIIRCHSLWAFALSGGVGERVE